MKKISENNKATTKNGKQSPSKYLYLTHKIEKTHKNYLVAHENNVYFFKIIGRQF